MIRKDLKNFDEVAYFLKSERLTLYTSVVNGVKECLENDIDELLLAEFNLLDENIVFKIDMVKKDWVDSLSLALAFFEETEEYEKCVEIKDLITQLDE